MRRSRHVGRTGLLIVAVVLLAGCRLFGYIGEPQRYVMAGSDFVLAWDAPNSFPGDSRVAGYTLFYREFSPAFSSAWRELGTAGARSPLTFRVNGASLPPGQYEFAVRSFDQHGNYSNMHRSTDSHADPPTGWYLEWLGEAP